jgi:hypothetical protein
MSQQRKSLPERGMFTIGLLVFYDVSRDESHALVFSIGKVLEVLKEEQQIKIQKYLSKTKMKRDKTELRYYEPQSGEDSTVLIAFDRVRSVQFQLNTGHQDIPKQALKKLESS